MVRFVRRAGATVVTVLLVTALAGLACLFWLVRHDGWLVQTVATGSMEPTVPTGSVIVSRPVDPGDIEVGDVIVFRSPSGATVSAGADGVFEATEAMLITHRVVAVRGSGPDLSFRTKGDGNANEDPWSVGADLVRARYVAHVPRIGALLASPDTRRWLFLGVAAIGCVVIVTEGRSVARELRSRREHPEAAPGDETVPATTSPTDE
ncbi:signal peptidase I [Actinotalea fermentans]|uniref:Signal peptidase I n=1 Tax=Actinotalea fermentans TaxID=43671 RepID=A0A511YV58_9CELL|nr:signal peptidase I [Actinotalea fermentans]KGM17233.1 hypothetical protein N867_07825 [Actinotalea fermentans ATCC 43279 = JCM 9966 = DSM 3133]GEN79046.1 hypothetical protein AFE02nite_07800 [Actinotalea fermentans]